MPADSHSPIRNRRRRAWATPVRGFSREHHAFPMVPPAPCRPLDSNDRRVLSPTPPFAHRPPRATRPSRRSNPSRPHCSSTVTAAVRRGKPPRERHHPHRTSWWNPDPAAQRPPPGWGRRTMPSAHQRSCGQEALLDQRDWTLEWTRPSPETLFPRGPWPLHHGLPRRMPPAHRRSEQPFQRWERSPGRLAMPPPVPRRSSPAVGAWRHRRRAPPDAPATVPRRRTSIPPHPVPSEALE